MQPSKKNQLFNNDRNYVWHPFTQMKDYAEQDHVLIEKAEGVFLFDADGNRYYDTNSSWWVNIHGHAHPRIRDAINNQFQQMDHVMFSGLTHPSAIELAEKLVMLSPEGLNKVFYSDNGSTAVEVAVKMSFQYWQHKGQKEKCKFIYLDQSYHGDTMGAVSVGGVEIYHATFKSLMFKSYNVPSPHSLKWENGEFESKEACLSFCITALRDRLEQSSHEVAAIIVEPMIQAAGGMLMVPAEYLRAVRELCDEFNVHLIADEVATGFGRTGKMFACEHTNLTPDLMCLSKGITAGVMPLSVTLATNDIYEAFYDDYATMKTFFHGHSFTGNPLACAVALESLRIFEDELVMDHVKQVSTHLSHQVQRFSASKHLANVRSLGMIAAFNLYENAEKRTPYNFTERMGFKVYLEGLKHGLMLRPLGDTLYYWLPLCTTEGQINDIVERTEKVLQSMDLY
jgi:adenosylmethionine-8-amino-7-oxononanoate aminotransferase